MTALLIVGAVVVGLSGYSVGRLDRSKNRFAVYRKGIEKGYDEGYANGAEDGTSKPQLCQWCADTLAARSDRAAQCCHGASSDSVPLYSAR